MEWDLFIGRFHPLLVHLPIGIFILGFILELQFQFGYRKFINSRKLIIFIYALGLLSGILAALTGWLLSFSNDYGINALDNHKQLGIATLLVMLLVIIYQVKAQEAKGKSKIAASTLVIILIGLTGHFGGNLTHGPDYLVKYGPGFIKNYEDVTLRDKLKGKHPDSVKIYSDIIYPIIQNNCISCHNTENAMGGLSLAKYNNLFKDADYAIPVLPKNPDKSELFVRVSLPADHDKAMPPRGPGFGYTDIEILRYWISNGADSLASFNSEAMSSELIALINRDYGLDYKPRPYYEKVKVDSLDNEILAELRNSRFRANYLSENNFLLDVSFIGDTISKDQIQILNRAASHITFLNLSNSNLTEELLNELVEIPHLNRINFSKNRLDHNLSSYLAKHQHIESANLNETDLTNESLQNLLSKSKLLRVYVLNTKVTKDQISSLLANYKNKAIISDFKFKEVQEPKSVFTEENSDR
ncbi:DUF2231 domain-containing protein [Geojedonia litorea]|uniref:DUF2231 domain-containing protein n=1 Tax=Geojedonia litorea TaxID=1268269 RepID=A0ABV9N5P4_9FLAO